MNILFKATGKTLIISVDGDLDHHSEQKIREEADRIFEREALVNILFDFKRTGFMDSSGIGVIMGRYKKASFAGGRAAVSGTKATLDRILKVSGVYKLVKQFHTVEEALTELEGKISVTEEQYE